MREIYLDMRYLSRYPYDMDQSRLVEGRLCATDIPRRRPGRVPRPARLAQQAAADREGIDPEFDRIEVAELLRTALAAPPGAAPGAE